MNIERIENWNKISRADMQWWHHLTDQLTQQTSEWERARARMYVYSDYSHIHILNEISLLYCCHFSNQITWLSEPAKKCIEIIKNDTHSGMMSMPCLCAHILLVWAALQFQSDTFCIFFNDSSLLFARIIWSRLQNCRKKRTWKL